MPALPMFPLGAALLPGETLPLRIFEPRYRAMMADCLASGDLRFGVVLIERGSEVGGGDMRSGVGVIAEIVQHRKSPDGTWSLFCQGADRIRVDEWLTDDPYPRARVSPWPDGPVADERWPIAQQELRAAAGELLACIQTFAAQAGQGVTLPHLPDADLPPAEFTWEAAAAMPITQVDRYDALAAPNPIARAEVLVGAIRDAESAFRFRMQ